MSFIDDLKFDAAGLIPAVVQDAAGGEVLMVAWMNRQALEQTFAQGRAHYYSRSRKKLWLKGEESGHFQKVLEVRADCDGDVLLLKVKQEGGAACHTGYRSCFHRKVGKKGLVAVRQRKVFDPEKVYKRD